MEPQRNNRNRRPGRERVYIAPGNQTSSAPSRGLAPARPRFGAQYHASSASAPHTTGHSGLRTHAGTSRFERRERHQLGDSRGLAPVSSARPLSPRPSAGRAFSPIRRPLTRPLGAGGRPLERRGLHSPHHERSHSPEHGGERSGSSVKKSTPIPPLKDDAIRVICLGGVEEVGRNMTIFEFRNDIIIVDMGLQFNDAKTPGIDFILPNTKYLEERKDKIRGVFITHGHLDHIGGIPYLMNRIGNPPIYTRNLTALMIKKRQEEFPHLPPIDFKIIEGNNRVTFGDLAVRFFGVTHSIPDCLGIIIETPYGQLVTPGDYKLDHIDGVPTDEEEAVYAPFAKDNNLLLLTDSTNVDNPGFSTPERLVGQNLAEIVRTTKTRLIVSMFASHIVRIGKIIEAAEGCNKKVAIEGRSMKNNIDICIAAGLIKVKDGTIIPSTEIPNYPPDRIIVLATGAQGDDFAALTRLANKSHKQLKLSEHDTVLLSASIVPGNEKAVQDLKDNIARHGTKIIHYRTSEVYIHSTGHGNRGEMEWLHKKIHSKFFIPIHGNHYMLRLHAELAQDLGMPKANMVIPDNGMVIEIQDGGKKIIALKEKAPNGPLMVDGFAVGDMQEVVLRDRQMLAEEGMFVIIASINSSNGKLKKSPDIISRGFVYLRESQDLLHQTRIIIKKTIEDTTQGMHPINFDYVKDQLTDAVSRFLFQKTAKRPIVIPVLLGV
ncbi:MAG: RNase J family beta-CASP ribonuclease [bacterium]|nr:RNase J family beta-CASP ribonuclease [bacterium]